MVSYGPISAEAYGIWFPEKQYEDADFFRKFIREGEGIALEVGCGDGRLLIPFVEEELKVEGVDLSPYMLQQCRNKAQKKGVQVTLYEQAMQDLKLSKQYSVIYIPYGSFMLVSQLEEAKRALRKFYEHLSLNGRVIIPLFIPTETDVHQEAPDEGKWRLRREGDREDGTCIRCWEKAHFDVMEQLEHAFYRYEVVRDNQVIATEEEELLLRWYTQGQFMELLTEAGFRDVVCYRDYSEQKATSKDSEFSFVGRK